MAEMIPQGCGVFKEGYKPNTKVAILELHRLVCIFLASKEFANLRDGPTHVLDTWDYLQEAEEDEITRILLSVAITARVIDDLADGVFDFVADDCGTLEWANKAKPLTLREACNKIIHASKVRFDVEHSAGGQAYVMPFIYLYGEKNGVEWRATLDVLKFAREYVGCVRHF
jgi:hypothetical protein